MSKSVALEKIKAFRGKPLSMLTVEDRQLFQLYRKVKILREYTNEITSKKGFNLNHIDKFDDDQKLEVNAYFEEYQRLLGSHNAGTKYIYKTKSPKELKAVQEYVHHDPDYKFKVAFVPATYDYEQGEIIPPEITFSKDKKKVELFNYGDGVRYIPVKMDFFHIASAEAKGGLQGIIDYLDETISPHIMSGETWHGFIQCGLSHYKIDAMDLIELAEQINHLMNSYQRESLEENSRFSAWFKGVNIIAYKMDVENYDTVRSTMANMRDANNAERTRRDILKKAQEKKYPNAKQKRAIARTGRER